MSKKQSYLLGAEFKKGTNDDFVKVCLTWLHPKIKMKNLANHPQERCLRHCLRGDFLQTFWPTTFKLPSRERKNISHRLREVGKIRRSQSRTFFKGDMILRSLGRVVTFWSCGNGKGDQASIWSLFFLRKSQHTLGAYLRTPKWKEFLHKPLVGGLGYVPGVCWKILRFLGFLSRWFQLKGSANTGKKI